MISNRPRVLRVEVGFDRKVLVRYAPHRTLAIARLPALELSLCGGYPTPSCVAAEVAEVLTELAQSAQWPRARSFRAKALSAYLNLWQALDRKRPIARQYDLPSPLDRRARAHYGLTFPRPPPSSSRSTARSHSLRAAAAVRPIRLPISWNSKSSQYRNAITCR